MREPGCFSFFALAAVLISAAVLLVCGIGEINAGALATHAAWGAEMAYSPDPFAEALGQLGLDSSVLGIDRADRGMFGGDKYRLHTFDVLSDDPVKIPPYTRIVRDSLLANTKGSMDILYSASSQIGRKIRITLVGEPLEDYLPKCEGKDALYDALMYMWDNMGGGKSIARLRDKSEFKNQCVEIPEELQSAAAIIIYGTVKAAEYRELAFADFSPEERENLFDAAMKYIGEVDSETPDAEVGRTVEGAADRVDWGYLYTGLMYVSHAVDLAYAKLKNGNVKLHGNSVRLPSPLGEIIFGSVGIDEYSGSSPFLVVETGGDDNYSSGARTDNADNWAGIILDMAGDDSYTESGALTPAEGAGVLGYGIVIDFSGNDKYSAKAVSQGAGLFGGGALIDLAGNDYYESVVGSQAAGHFGAGALWDAGGDDVYYSYQTSQGYGWTLGCGILLDNSGNDEYIAEDADIKFPSAQSDKHNSSLCQGFGFGKRADITDGHSMAGGVGILVDGAGDDKYSCGVFGQGAAYWYGVGILADVSGNDSYFGQWYVQASCAHFGVGILDDAAGDDRYTAKMNMAQGAGHDFSVGFLFEEGGNDVYEAPNLSLGGGNAQGTGIFWDVKGDDEYRTSGVTLGQGNGGPRGSLRDLMRTIGLFLDTGGDDTYPGTLDFAGNNAKWTRPGPDTANPIRFEIGCGLDAEMQVILNSATR
ncbi:MAG: hypothetical protein HRF49_09565 [bacterium]|jgi:hypothetical protein